MNRALTSALLLGLIPSLLSAAQAPTPAPAAQRPTIPIPPADAVPGTVPAPMDAATLQRLFQAELGPLFTPQIAPKVAEAHALIEQYFAVKTAAERTAVVRKLEALKLDPNLIGRLTRVRANWPDLKGGVYYVNERVGPHNVLYFLGVPESYDRTKPWPLLVKLPGAHAFLGDPPPTAKDVVETYTAWMKDELKDHPDALVLMPLLNLDELYGPSYKGMSTVIQPLLHVAWRANVDPRRVYMLGQGMPGHAAWNLVIHYPTYFAAINPMAAGLNTPFQIIRLPNLRNIFCIVWHDSEDPLVKVEVCRRVIARLRELKYEVEYQEAKNVGHAPNDESIRLMYDKMRMHTRELYPKEVVLSSDRPDTVFNRVDWVQVWQPIYAGKEEVHRMVKGTGTIITEATRTLTAKISAPNRIDVTSTNVQSFRLYLNDQMVDLSKPVTLFVNKVKRFEGDGAAEHRGHDERPGLPRARLAVLHGRDRHRFRRRADDETGNPAGVAHARDQAGAAEEEGNDRVPAGVISGASRHTAPHRSPCRRAGRRRGRCWRCHRPSRSCTGPATRA